MIADLLDKTASGRLFSEALSYFPSYFSKRYQRVVASGECCGRLALMLSLLATQMNNKEKTVALYKKMMRYPMIVLIISCLVCVFMLLFVVPKFADLFSSLGGHLPFLTQTLFSLSQEITHHQISCFAFVMSSILGVSSLRFLKPNGRKFLQRIALKVPGLSPLVMQKNNLEWLLLFAMLLDAKISLTVALTMAAQSLDNHTLEVIFLDVAEKVANGSPLHEALSCSPYIDKKMCAMIAIGEQSGCLSSWLSQYATLELQKLQDTLTQLGKLIEPVMMLVVAAMIGVLMVAMYLPIFKMGQLF